ncbi:UNVERIFIED_CONTAM: hypothetical protein FKN15_013669 [Acipenser sinensis]
MQVLARLRYILEVVRPGPRVVQDVLEVLTRIARHSSASVSPRVVQDVLEVLTRIARHSSASASQVLDAPRLMQTILSEFLPCFWTQRPPAPPGGPLTLETAHGLPVAAAMKLIRVLACSGRHACARLLNSLGLRERLSRYLALEPQDLLLEPREAVRLSTEALRLWSIAAGYGQACDLYSNPESDTPPPPPVEWSHVTGLRPFLVGSLKSCVGGLSDPLLREGAQRLSAAILLYLGSFYTQLPAQIPVHAAVSQHASLYHQVAMAMLPRLLPGSEHLAHDLLSTLTFNPDFIPEGRCGGPEAADLNQLLHLKESHSDPSPLPASQPDPSPSSSPSSSLGALLREAYSHLPSLRSCYLTHLSQLEPLVLRSRESYLGCTPFVQSQLPPPLSSPPLPSDWPFLPLVTLYERAGQAESRGCAVETLPPASVESAVRCLQWLLVLELWREGGGKAVSPAAKLCRLACLFLCGSDLFLEPPVQRYGWAVLRSLCSPPQLAALDLGFPGSPPPGLASFQDLYSALLAQFEAVSFGDPLFGCFLLIPLQRRFSAELRLAVFGEHVGLLRSLGVTLAQVRGMGEGEEGQGCDFQKHGGGFYRLKNC